MGVLPYFFPHLINCLVAAKEQTRGLKNEGNAEVPKTAVGSKIDLSFWLIRNLWLTSRRLCPYFIQSMVAAQE